MREVINVSIAGIAFKLDDEAYRMLDDYLVKINKNYGSEVDGREIIEDIEARVAEIILSRQDSTMVVTEPLIEKVISQLGMPEEIGYQNDNTAAADKTADREPASRFSRRLYRNPFNSKLGGVCSGFATYFDIDVTLVRMFFMSPLILGVILSMLRWILPVHNSITGFLFSLFPVFVLLYVILWIIIPKAKNPRQYLEMKGEKITSSRIEKVFYEEFTGMQNIIRNKSSLKGEKNASISANLVGIFGKTVLLLIYGVLVLLGLSIVVLMIYIFVSGINFFAIGSHNLVLGSLAAPLYTFIVMGLVVLILPLIIAVYSIVKLIFSFTWNKTFLYVASIGWVATFVSCAVIFYVYFHNNDYEVRLKNIVVEGRSFHAEGKERKLKFESDNMKFYITENSDLNIGSGNEFTSDTLHVMPIDTTSRRGYRSIPVNFIWGNQKYKQPTIEIKRTYRDIFWSIVKSKKLPELSTIGYRYTNDTLYISNSFKMMRSSEYAQIDIYLPNDNLVIDVDGRIRYYEFDY